MLENEQYNPSTSQITRKITGPNFSCTPMTSSRCLTFKIDQFKSALSRKQNILNTIFDARQVFFCDLTFRTRINFCCMPNILAWTQHREVFANTIVSSRAIISLRKYAN